MCEPVTIASAAISAGGQIASHQAAVGAARDSNNAKLKNFHRQNQEYKVTANLDNVKYLNDVIDQDQDQDRTYQAMLDQWSDTDVQLKKLPPDVQKIVNLIQEGEARGFTGEELRKFVFNRAAKLGIGGSVLAGIFADDD